MNRFQFRLKSSLFMDENQSIKKRSGQIFFFGEGDKWLKFIHFTGSLKLNTFLGHSHECFNALQRPTMNQNIFSWYILKWLSIHCEHSIKRIHSFDFMLNRLSAKKPIISFARKYARICIRIVWA